MIAKRLQDLAAILVQIDKAARTMDDTAGKILDAIRTAEADTLEKFDAMVDEAYDKNAWTRRVGRPMPGDNPSPKSVRVYISTIRRAYRAGVDVMKARNFDALREEAKAKSESKPARPVEPQLVGLQIDKPNKLTGALVHDIAVLWENLPEQQQAQFEEKLKKLVEQYTKKAPPVLRLVS